MLGFERFRSAVIVPDVVTGVEPIVREPDDETPTDVTVPEPAPTPIHDPFIAKQPAVILKPTLEVEVA